MLKRANTYYLVNNKTQKTMNIPVPYIIKGNEVHTTVEGVTGVPFPAGLPSVEEDNNEEIAEK